MTRGLATARVRHPYTCGWPVTHRAGVGGTHLDFAGDGGVGRRRGLARAGRAAAGGARRGAGRRDGVGPERRQRGAADHDRRHRQGVGGRPRWPERHARLPRGDLSGQPGAGGESDAAVLPQPLQAGPPQSVGRADRRRDAAGVGSVSGAAADPDTGRDHAVDAARHPDADGAADRDTHADAVAHANPDAHGTTDRDADTDAAAHGNADTDAAAHGNADADAAAHGNADADAAAHGNADADAAAHGNADTDAAAHGNADADAAAHGNADTDAAAHGNADADAGANRHPDADAAPHRDADARAVHR